jgi:hypothetical protein
LPVGVFIVSAVHFYLLRELQFGSPMRTSVKLILLGVLVAAVAAGLATAAKAARSALLHKQVPGIETVIALYQHVSQFAHSADALALDPYPCQNGHCDYSSITELAAEADRDGVKYYGIVQAFGDPPHYDLPTTAQLHRIFQTWRATNMSGYFVFAWSWPQEDPSLWLENTKPLLGQLRTENGA